MAKGYNRANPFSDNPDIELTRTKTNSLEWHKERSKGIGASEVPIILGKAKWENTSIWKLWQEKVGLVPSDFAMTERMAHGIHMEDRVADMWKYYHPDPNMRWYEDFVRNYQGVEEIPQRRMLFNLNAIVRNKNYAWLSANLDRIAPPGTLMADLRTVSEDKFLVEIKNIDSMIARHYEDEIPAYYHSQAQTQMLVTGLSYYEFAVFLSGNRLEVKGYYPDANLMAEIVEVTHDFWYNKVLPARELMQVAKAHQEAGNLKGYEEVVAEIYQKYEPAPMQDEKYHEYVRERYKYEYSSEEKLSYVMAGDDEIYAIAEQQAILSAVSGVLEDAITASKARIEDILRKSNVKVIEFDNGKKITWFPNKGADKPTLRSNLLNKKNLDMDKLEGIIKSHINNSLLK